MSIAYPRARCNVGVVGAGIVELCPAVPLESTEAVVIQHPGLFSIVELDGGDCPDCDPAPNTGYQRHVPFGNLATSSPFFSVPASATPHEWGTRVELEDSTPFAANSFELGLAATAVGSANTPTIVEIALGADGEEVPFLTIGAGFLLNYTTLPVHRWLFNKTIPAGSRITARTVALRADQNCGIFLALREDGWGGGMIRSYGLTQTTGSTTTDGQILTTAANVNELSAWTQIGELSHDAVELSYSLSGVASSLIVGTGYVQIGIGESGAQEVVLDGIPYNAANDETFRYAGCPAPLRRPLVAGTKVWMRYQCTSTSSASRPRGAVYAVSA